jgi:2-iminoacetate synthase ThiH
MQAFSIDPEVLATRRDHAQERALKGEGRQLASDLGAGKPLDDDDLATLFLSNDVPTKTLLEVARQLQAPGAPRIETFSPLYISNECDAECLMCGMRRINTQLHRVTASDAAIAEQLDILYRRGLRGVALLTGEYRRGPVRGEMLGRTIAAARSARKRGFAHVLLNIGSLEIEEYEESFGGLSPCSDESMLTMCTFQETYDPIIYEKFMGSNRENPRSDFNRRIENFDRAADAGFRSVNPGVLLGLNRDLVYELLALSAHVRHLLARDLTVYISVPRLRKASGAVHHAGVSDDDFTRVVALLSAAFPEAKVVVSTREAPDMQRLLVPVIGVLTAGSPGVAPYTDGDARFDIKESQFEVADQRPIEVILAEHVAAGATIDGYEPATTSVANPA